MSRLHLSFAATRCDRFAALRDERVRPEGIELTMLSMPVEEVFFRQLGHAEFDVSEMSLSSYTLGRDGGDDRFVALPVYPSRYFRHQNIYVRTGSGITRPEQLDGRRVGVPEYQMTAPVWQRGILGEHHGVDLDSITWVTGGAESPGRTEKIALDLPDRVQLETAPPDRSLTDLLAAGELDGLITAHSPGALADGLVEPLFPGHRDVEAAYFRATGIFPIMHVLVVRREILAQNPWVATSLVDACLASRDAAMDDLRYRSALLVALPWLAAELDRTVALLGESYWSYGVEANRHVLETFLRYSSEQGLVSGRLTVEDLFDMSTEARYSI